MRQSCCVSVCVSPTPKFLGWVCIRCRRDVFTEQLPRKNCRKHHFLCAPCLIKNRRLVLARTSCLPLRIHGENVISYRSALATLGEMHCQYASHGRGVETDRSAHFHTKIRLKGHNSHTVPPSYLLSIMTRAPNAFRITRCDHY
jgi:hypothetical protein